ncbi:MAG: hypothetical protein HOC77_00035 [Chloroflexi bacterium]|jgi:hypothetical protein|nr:hypothetical protein [Chloroflexota bacterium]MBT4073030.1 hypothetical protein [Chloroflexota bacterium]MBT4513463.1 hypothetical protein [Chloroflexota bacterium]MBT5320495.1 hypothetical protein [Chloroflexota bacterium]MBT6681744.1 hypothetical protein [Chloroflexota bacterium]
MPQILSDDALRRASNFMKLLSRPLERALFNLEFGDGTRDAVIKELAEFQNDDGGFGNGIEPDVWMPESSPLATTVALQHISAISVPPDHPLVVGAIAYLINSYDEKRAGWSKVSWEVEDAPHAPWWNYSPKLDRAFDPTDWGNPAAEIIGYLNEYASLVPAEFLGRTNNLAIENLTALADKIEMHVLLCYLRLHERIGDRIGSTQSSKLVVASKALMIDDPSTWRSYHTPPTWLAPGPDSFLAGDLAPRIGPYLDHLI